MRICPSLSALTSLSWALLAVGCGGKGGVDTADSRAGTPSDTAPSGTAPTDTGNRATLDTGFELNLETIEGVVPVAVDRSTWLDVGYVMVTYQVSADAPEPYDSLFEAEDPTFYLWRPIEVSPDAPIPLLVWFHGSAVGDDTIAESGGEFPDPCSLGQITGGSIETNLVGPSMAPKLAAMRGWAMVMPRNDWCDAWIGRGPDDAVDPERHFGYYHVARTLDWLRAGYGGFSVDEDRIYAWGTSSGATGAMITAERYEKIDAVVFDSGISSWLTYYDRAGEDYGTNTSEVVHIFGGEPYDKAGAPNGEVYDRYVEASPALMIQDEGFRKPLFIAWNTEDLNLGTEHATEMIASTTDSYGPDDRWNSKDFNHLYPSPRGHVQTIYGQLPLGYTPYALMDFLSGSRLLIEEAEDGCTLSPCEVGRLATSADDPAYEAYSHGVARVAGAGEAGLLYTGPLPPQLPAGAPARVALSMKSVDHDGLDSDTALGRLVYLEGGVELASKTLTAGDMAPSVTSDPSTDVQVIRQYQETWLTFTPTDIANGELRYYHEGLHEVRLDTVIFLY